MMCALARVLVNALVIVCFGVSLTCPEMAVCVRGNAADVYSYTINARCVKRVIQCYANVIQLVYQCYNMRYRHAYPSSVTP